MSGVLFPPRPSLKISPGLLPTYEAMGDWIVQRKYNGQRNLINITPDGDVKLFNGEGKSHLSYDLPTFIKKQILDLKIVPGQEYWFDSELMHNKTGNLKNTIILFDVLFCEKYLFGVDQLSRLKLLSDLCGNPSPVPCPDILGQIATKVDANLGLAPYFDRDFVDRYREIIHLDEIEGLVLRRKASRIDNLGQKEYSVSWMIRCRKEHKNYNF